MTTRLTSGSTSRQQVIVTDNIGQLVDFSNLSSTITGGTIDTIANTVQVVGTVSLATIPLDVSVQGNVTIDSAIPVNVLIDDTNPINVDLGSSTIDAELSSQRTISTASAAGFTNGSQIDLTPNFVVDTVSTEFLTRYYIQIVVDNFISGGNRIELQILGQFDGTNFFNLADDNVSNASDDQRIRIGRNGTFVFFSDIPVRAIRVVGVNNQVADISITVLGVAL